jgi:hypothetical protein
MKLNVTFGDLNEIPLQQYKNPSPKNTMQIT